MARPWYPKYPADYTLDTRHLSLAEHGAYNLLLDLYYGNNGPISSDIGRLSKVIGAVDSQCMQALENVVREFFQVDPSNTALLRHNKCDRIIQDSDEQHKKLSEAGRKGMEKRWGNGYSKVNNDVNNEAIASHTHTHTVKERDGLSSVLSLPNPAPVDKSTSEAFEAFWRNYPKKKSRGDAERSWAKIKPDQKMRVQIMAKLNALKKSAGWIKDGGEFIPYPASWLNAKGWEDEVGVESGDSGQPCCAPECQSTSNSWWNGRRYCHQHYMFAKRGEADGTQAIA